MAGVTRDEAHELAGLVGRLRAVYRAAYGEPLWSETEDDVERFQDDGDLVGACYAYRFDDAFPPGDLSYEVLLAQLDPHLVARHLLGVVEISELMVHPQAQGSGIGTARLG
ncbi:hypothetical protein [Frankia sp. Cppng1_Ct_nod]|uniref:hypothetical protein n=1 Tax=Frankia sp. Cppng1_Ct_nod TaxID=2897162 RepID=UPI0013EF964E|nr:hypothetical protein [Frankia sp. Cppng1_Ct_nod]